MTAAVLEAAPPIRRDRMVHSWLTASTVSATGDAVFTIALAWTAVRLYSAGVAGLVIGVETLPQAVLTLLGGVIADRYDTRRVMIAGECGRVAVLLIAALDWFAGTRSAGVLLALAVAFGIAAGLTDPVRSTLPRQLVSDADLPVVSGWSQIGGRLAVLGGSPLGAVLVAVAGLGTAMLVDAGSFVVVITVLVVVVRPRRRIRAAQQPQRWHEAMAELRRYLRRNTSARLLTVGICALNVFVAPVTGIGVALRVSASGWPATWLGAADATFAVAAIVGSAAAMRWRSRRIAARGFLALVVQGAALAAVGIGTLVTLLVAMAAIGITAGLASVWISGAFQRTIDGTHLGRVSSVSQLGDQVLVPVATPAFGVLAGATGVLVATAVFGSAMALLSAGFASRPGIRRLP